MSLFCDKQLAKTAYSAYTLADKGMMHAAHSSKNIVL